MSAASGDASDDAGERFLAALPLPERPRLPFRTSVVVAHADDETIGCGAQMPRFSDVTIVHLTDGAPRSLTDAETRGFATAEAYAATRAGELRAAMGLAGIPSERLVALGWPDQESTQHLAEISTDLAERLACTEIVLTHAYEGGHPDHDTAALAVWAACALLRRAGESAPAAIEMPLYHLGQEGWMRQVFVPAAGTEEIAVELTPEERRLKQKMFAAQASQADVLANFGTAVERFRRAPRYDFARLPNGGKLLYEDWNWGMNGARWLKYSQAALAELGLGGAA